MDSAEKFKKQRDLIAGAFRREYENQTHKPLLATLAVYEAPAADNWIVVVTGTREAWVADGEGEEFVFWGPLGKKPIIFAIPQEWPT